MRLERAPIEIIQALPLLFHIHNTTRKLILKYIRLLDHRANSVLLKVKGNLCCYFMELSLSVYDIVIVKGAEYTRQ